MAIATAERLLGMIKVIFRDGYELEGESYEEVATKLWFDSFSSEDNVQDYMQGMIHRAKLQTGKDISFTDYESFFKELHRIGLVTSIGDAMK